MLLGWLLSLYLDHGQPAGGGGVLVHQGGGDLILAPLLLVVLVSFNILGVLTHTSEGQLAAGSWLQPGHLRIGELEVLLDAF